ncbi:hypothetical protein FAUST_7604 [Fusarium austroamericanum]|uniref:HNH nuclease domain-containing protein n=1 Tax=Fusarium austroamericanum TaxID=282268 RepID=A0AAN5Z687_FUSAU|nr:hypothetical protein FAUST_7604 [Fusarium austroamericanum]
MANHPHAAPDPFLPDQPSFIISTCRKVKKIDAFIKEAIPDFKMTHDEIAVIVLNPNVVEDEDMTRRLVTGEDILEDIHRHMTLSNQFLMSTTAQRLQPERYTELSVRAGPLGNNTTIHPNSKGVPRDGNVREQVCARDDHKCVLTGLGYSESAHIIPHCVVKTPTALKVLADCWQVVGTLVDSNIHKTYLPWIVNSIGFEKTGNQISLAKHVHNYLDRALWAFKPHHYENGETRNYVMFYWLPDLFSQNQGKKVNLNEPNQWDNYVSNMINATKESHRRGFPAPRPKKGSGVIAAQRLAQPHDRRLISGDIFVIRHADAESAQLSHHMMDVS